MSYILTHIIFHCRMRVSASTSTLLASSHSPLNTSLVCDCSDHTKPSFSEALLKFRLALNVHQIQAVLGV